MKTLQGEWKFIGAERYADNEWRSDRNYVREMMWEFMPHITKEQMVEGTIIERTHNCNHTELSYTYNRQTNSLIIIDNDSTDIYRVSESDLGSEQHPIIKLEILNPEDIAECQPPQFRYVLQRW